MKRNKSATKSVPCTSMYEYSYTCPVSVFLQICKLQYNRHLHSPDALHHFPTAYGYSYQSRTPARTRTAGFW